MADSQVDRVVRALLRSPDNPCFGCGPNNPIGLHLDIEHCAGGVRAEFVPGALYQGWEGVIHGGILATALDEIMAQALHFAGIKGVTARLEVRFRHAVTTGQTLVAEAEITRDARRLVDVEGRLVRDGAVVAEATGRFAKVGTLGDLQLGPTSGMQLEK